MRPCCRSRQNPQIPIAYRKLMEEYQTAGMLPVYDTGFITLDKQFLTIGINGMAEAAESPRHQSRLQRRLHQLRSRPSENHIRSQPSRQQTLRREVQHRVCPRRKPRRENAKWDQSRRLQSQPPRCYNSISTSSKTKKSTRSTNSCCTAKNWWIGSTAAPRCT